MSAILVQPPFELFTDIDGQPLEAGFVWVGQSNLDPQTNPIQVYWDQALTIPAAQPLRTIGGYVVNSGTPSRIYVDGVAYSIRVMNKNGSTIYSEANVTGVDPNASGVVFTGFKGQSGFVSDLADDDGAEWIGFEPAGIGAVARSAQDKLRETVSVKDFGAVGDGVTDDTAAIQAALNYSKYVEAPEGTYRLDGYIEIPANTAFVLKNANLRRLSSQSSSTDPLVHVGNSGAKLIGFGNPAVSSENNSPLGVVAVFPRLLDRNVFRPGVSGIRIIGNSDASSICLRVRSGASESATGVTYFGSYRDLDLSYAGTLLYLGPQANAHMFENVLGAHFSGPMIDLVGLPGVDDRCYANGFVNFWSTNALPGGTNQPMVRGRHALNNFGINMFGEHGGTLPRWLDFDATCSNNSFFGSSNLSGGSAIAAGSRTAAIPTGNIHADIISWTPTIIGETVAGSHTYFSQIGSIMRVGRLVQVSFSIAVNSWDAACAGNLLIAGLPVGIATGQDASLNVSDWAGFTLPAGYSALNLLGRVGTNEIRVRRVGQLVSPANVTAAERTGGLTTIISGSGTFITTALY